MKFQRKFHHPERIDQFVICVNYLGPFAKIIDSAQCNVTEANEFGSRSMLSSACVTDRVSKLGTWTLSITKRLIIAVADDEHNIYVYSTCAHV